MPLYAGLDCSGTPDLRGTEKRHQPYVVCIAAVEDMEELGRRLSQVRHLFGMAAHAEFRGHETTDRMQAAVLEAGIAVGLCAGALIIDKEATRGQHAVQNLPSPADFQVLTAIALLERFLPHHPLVGLWCDEDIKGKERQQAFVTDVKRIHRAAWPYLHVKVRHRPSESSDLVQLADIVAYALSRHARGLIETTTLHELIVQIRSDSHNIILGPMAWGMEADIQEEREE